MASAKLDMVNQLRALEIKLKKHEEEIEAGVDRLETGKKNRGVMTKEILLKEVKAFLANLNELDNRLVKDMKSEVFDCLREMGKVGKEIPKLIESVKASDSKDMDTMLEAVEEVKKQVDRMELSRFCRYLIQT